MFIRLAETSAHSKFALLCSEGKGFEVLRFYFWCKKEFASLESSCVRCHERSSWALAKGAHKPWPLSGPLRIHGQLGRPLLVARRRPFPVSGCCARSRRTDLFQYLADGACFSAHVQLRHNDAAVIEGTWCRVECRWKVRHGRVRMSG